MADEFEVTEGMIDAGIEELRLHRDGDDIRYTVKAVFWAMTLANPVRLAKYNKDLLKKLADAQGEAVRAHINKTGKI